MKINKKIRVISALLISGAMSLTTLSAPFSAFADTVKSTIGTQKAKTIALNDAKVKSSNARFVTAKFDIEDGKQVYEVEFYVGNKEYDYVIDAGTGRILEKDTDLENDVIVTAPSKSQAGKSIALNHSKKKASDVSFVKTELDQDDGRVVYDIQFYFGNKKYNYEIDATTGKILTYEEDNVDFD